jgi:HK97 family phage major capsid protein
MTRSERKLKAVEDEIARHSTEIRDVWTKADDDGERETTPEERGEVEAHLKAIDHLKEEQGDLEANIRVEKEVHEKAKGYGSAESVVVTGTPEPEAPQMKSLGEQFLESDQYKRIFEKGAPGGQWSTGEIKLDAKGTLLSGGTVSGAASPYDYQAGIIETLFQRLTIADLLATGTTTSPQVRYNRETSATSGAAGVAEGEAKPESALAFTEVTEAVKKIATILPVSEEMLEDVAQIEAYINQRLSLFIKIEEERELLRGAGGGNGVQGIVGRTGVNTFKAGTATTISDHIFNVANNTRGSSFLEPDGVVMNPEQWAKVRLAKDNQGQYYGGGPFYGAYGNSPGGGPAGASQLQQGENIWGLRVIVTSAIGAGTALIGAFRQGAQVFRRSGLTVEASNSHEDFFRKNLTAIRAEERLALALYRPSAFTTVTFE